MDSDRLSEIFKILDNENHLLERADQKAISMLSVLGVFMVFFIVYYRLIPVNIVSVALISIYFLSALMAILSLIMTVRPRIRQSENDEAEDDEKMQVSEPGFFAGISKYPNFSAYKQALENMVKDETAVIDVYSRQIYNIARINSAKYKHIQRAVFLVIIALTTELAIITYLFIYHLGEGILPSIG